MRAREAGLACGQLPPGVRNSIADVPGVRVGHATVRRGEARTGVTAVLAHGGDLFQDKPLAAVDVLNGFGKSVGLVQVEELGTLETPVLLTNTFAVGTCANALIRRAVAANPAIGRSTGTVNPVVLECNDGFLSDIQAMAVTEADAGAAIEAASADFALGAVGAGAGMSAFGLKGGIGTASRRIRLDGVDHHLGALVLANFGRAGDLTLPDGSRIDPGAPPAAEGGSAIVVLATDAPLLPSQCRRLAQRATIGVARVGGLGENGSGDIFMAFSTHNRIATAGASCEPLGVRMLPPAALTPLFEAAAEATEEAIANALCAATTTSGIGGRVAHALPHDLLRRALGR